MHASTPARSKCAASDPDRGRPPLPSPPLPLPSSAAAASAAALAAALLPGGAWSTKSTLRFVTASMNGATARHVSEKSDGAP